MDKELKFVNNGEFSIAGAWERNVVKQFQCNSDKVIYNHLPQNARFLMEKILENGSGIFYLFSTRLCYKENSQSDNELVFDNESLIQATEKFLKMRGNEMRVITRQKPHPSKFYSLLKTLSHKEKISHYVLNERFANILKRLPDDFYDFCCSGNSIRIEEESGIDKVKARAYANNSEEVKKATYMFNLILENGKKEDLIAKCL